MSLMPGSRLGPYEILAPLGAGGMGEVWRAKDVRVDRQVALKVLPEEFFEDEEKRARFGREAKLLASLNHPGIATLYSFEEDGGRHLLVMELIEGESLSKRVKAGPVPMREALAIGRDIAAALEAAHAKGIVHRDLKPGNVMISADGRVKLLDFGLAKSFSENIAPEDLSHSPTLTDTGTAMGVILGTAAYMSPEQARGQHVDARTDVWAFGVVLWELLAGKRLFRGQSTPDTLAAVLHEPVDFRALPLTTPRAIRDLLARCLVREPEKRLADVGAARRELEKVIAGSASRRFPALTLAAAAAVVLLLSAGGAYVARRNTSTPTAERTARSRKPARIVVLPFENLGSPQDAYLAAGMTEEISSRLANLQGLSVISRTTAIGYERRGKTVKQIGADLGVDFVLEGTVLSDHAGPGGGRMRVAPQLIQVADDTRVWADRYDRVLSDIFAIQSEVAESAVRAMGVKLVPREKTALTTASTNDLEAYGLYLRGLETTDRGFTKQNLEAAIHLFQTAVDRDSRFVQALEQLARVHLYVYFLHYDRTMEHVDKARQVVDRLTAIGSDAAETHIARGYYFYWGLLDYPRALAEFKEALDLQPSSSEVLEGVSYILRRQGRWEDSAEKMVKWVEIDPRSPTALAQYGQTCVLLGRYAEADRVLGLAASLNPRFGQAWGFRGLAQVLWRGDIESAQSILSEASRVADLDDGLCRVAYASFRVTLMRRDLQGALSQLEREKREALQNQFYFYPIDLLRGEVLVLSGSRDQAIRSFDVARRGLEQVISKQPEDASRYYSALGIALAGLGLRDDAIRAANRGVEMMPASKDAWRALFRIEDLALVQTMLGQQDEAIDRLDFILSRTGEFSTQILRLDPRWDALKSSPRFGALLSKYGDPPASP